MSRYTFLARSKQESRSQPSQDFLSFRCVVAFAGEDLQILIGGFDLEFAEFSVLGRIGGVVTQGVLAAELLRDFIEWLHEFFLRVCRKHPAACFFGWLVCCSRGRDQSRVGDENYVTDRVGSLGGLDGL